MAWLRSVPDLSSSGASVALQHALDMLCFQIEVANYSLLAH